MRPSRIALLACAASVWASHAQAFPWPGRVRSRVTGVVGEQRSMYLGSEIRLRVRVQSGAEPPEWYRFDLDIAGLEAGLDLWTSLEVYRTVDPVVGLGSLTNGPMPVVGGPPGGIS